MSNHKQKIRIPLPEKQALDPLLKGNPTTGMPRQGKHPVETEKTGREIYKHQAAWAKAASTSC